MNDPFKQAPPTSPCHVCGSEDTISTSAKRAVLCKRSATGKEQPVAGSPVVEERYEHCNNCGEEWYRGEWAEEREAALRRAGFVFNGDTSLNVKQTAWARLEIQRIQSAPDSDLDSADLHRLKQLQRRLDTLPLNVPLE